MIPILHIRKMTRKLWPKNKNIPVESRKGGISPSKNEDWK